MLCRLHRFMISHAVDANGGLNPLTQRHIAHCPACRSFHKGWQTLGHRLRSQATDLEPVSQRVTERIAHALTGPPQPKAPTAVGFRWAVAACVAVALLIAFVAVTQTDRHSEPADVRLPAFAQAEAHLQTTWSYLIKHPLATELDNLTSDTESGVRFLVACVNVTPTSEEPRQAR